MTTDTTIILEDENVTLTVEDTENIVIEYTETLTVTGVDTHNALPDLQGGTAAEYYHLTSALLSKLTALPSDAAPDQTAAEILALMLTVDGTGSLLDADLLDAQNGTYYLDWNNFSNIPTTFTPSTHSHIALEITDLSTTLDGYIASITNIANGIAGLDITGKIPVTILPTYTISVNGASGIVVLDSDDISEGAINKYYSDALVSANTDVAGNTAARHTHTNKSLLDTYTQTDAALITAVTNSHTHTNKSILDLVEEAYTTVEKSKLAGIEALAEVNNISDVNATDLTDSGDTTLHYHASDRDRANHTGTQTASTVSDFDAQVDLRISAQKAVALGLATLDGSGLVPSTQLPSYVDDVLEYASLVLFPVTGTTGKIYVALDTNKIYRWSGTTYIQIEPGAVIEVNGQTGIVLLSAINIPSSPTGNVIATDTQAAIAELDSQDTAHANTTTGVHGVTGTIVGTSDSQALTNKTIVAVLNTITTTASGNLISTELNAALAELDGQDTTIQTNLTNHINDTVAAHAASAISNTAAGNIIATTVQAAINELDGQDTTIQGNLDTHTGSSTVHGIAGNVLGTSDAQTITNKTIVVASNTITTAPSGNLVATELNTALAELDGQDTTIQGNLNTHTALTAAHGTTGNIVGTSDSQTLTNKTIDLTDNTITGTLAEVNTAISDDNVFGVSELTKTVGNLTTPLCSIDLQNGISGKWKGSLAYENLTAVDRTYVDRYGVVQYAGTDVLREGLIEGASQNDALHSRDFTNAAWVKTNGTAALDATGKDGTATSASSFTATAANATVLQTIANASEVRTYSADVKRRTGTGTVEITLDGGTTWTDITSSLSTTDWARAIVTQTVTNSQFGFRLGTSGDAIEVDFNDNKAKAYATARIPTTTAAVANQADTLSFPARGNIPNPDNGLTIFMDFTPLADGAGYATLRMFGSNDSGGANYEWRTIAGAYALTTYTGGFQQAILASDVVAGAKARWAFSYKNVGSNVEWSISKDGVVKGSGSVAGSITVPDDVFEIGYWSNDSTHADGIYDNIRIMDHITGTEVIVG